MVQRLLRAVCSMIAMAGPPSLFLLLLLSFQLAVHGAADGPPPGSVKIDSLTYAGNGCSFDDTELLFTDDGLVVHFKKFHATTERSRAHRRRSCTVSATIRYPRGFKVGVGSVTLKGSAKLDRGVSGSIRSLYYFSGQRGTAHVSREIYGRFHEDFEYTNTFNKPLYSKCGAKQTVTMKAEVEVKPGKAAKGSGRIQVKSIPQLWQLVWKRC